MVTQMQGADTRLVNYSSQLNSRYETLKSNTRDLVNRWQDYVRDHQSYQSNYSQCVEWVETLKKRQEVELNLTCSWLNRQITNFKYVSNLFNLRY